MRGVTLLIAVVVTLAVLMIAIGVFALLVDEIRFSRTAEDSLTAFYAADSGVECALFWDRNENLFSTTSPPTSLDCAGATNSITAVDSDTFTFTLSFPNDSCVQVTVDKLSTQTTITSQGRNTLCGAVSSRTVQRGLRVTY